MECVKTFLLAVLALAVWLPAQCEAQAAQIVDREYKLKAAFLYQFTKYIEFPDSSFSDSSSFRIGIVGVDPFGERVLGPLETKVVGGRKIVVRRFKSLEEAQGCQILFISNKTDIDMAEFAATTKGAPILTIGETDGFAAKWGILNFVSVGGKIKFELNSVAAGRCGLRVDGRFQRVAIRVNDEHVK